MPTYENCYEILADVRRGINEYEAAFLTAADTTCPHSNEYIVKCINQAQRYIFNILFRRIPNDFLRIEDITITSSVGTLPWDFGKLRYFKDEKGYQVHSIGMEDVRLTNATGHDRLYYKRGNTLVVDKNAVNETYTLCYYTKPREITQGTAAAGAATSITLATSAKKIADYYNGMTIENDTKDWVDVIDDYATTRVATISETAAAADFYGIVPEFPEPFHFLVAPKAIHILKAESPVMQEKPTKNSIGEWASSMLEALRAYAGSDLDRDIESLFVDYEPEFDAYTGIVQVE